MHRSLRIRGVDAESVPDVSINQIRPDAIPDREINAVRLALADGEKFLSSNYTTRRLTVEGHFYSESRAVYEQRRDSLLGVLDSDKVIDIVFEQAGANRRYYGLYENINFEYKERGLCLFSMTIRCTVPFGEEVDETEFINETGLTDEYNLTEDIGGNIYALPRITININDIEPDDADKTLTIDVTTEGESRRIEITRTWSDNDTISIDVQKQRVYVNGIKADYVGRFPVLYKTTNFRFTYDVDTIDYDLIVRYRKRYL